VRQIDEIKRSDVVRLLDKIEDENGAAMAHCTLAFLRKLFNWQASRTDDFRSPIVRGMSRVKPSELARSRILTDDEIRKVWAAANEMPNAFGPLVKFLFLTGTRLHEAARMTWDELDGGTWIIPEARYKNGNPHCIPLSTTAKAILDATRIIDGSKWAFTNDGRRAVDGMSWYKKRIDEMSGVTGWRLHDLRRTARSLLSRAGVNADIAERCLGHVIGGVRGVYDRHAYVEEKRRAFEALAAIVKRIINPPESNGVELRGAQ
jgi:integrase